MNSLEMIALALTLLLAGAGPLAAQDRFQFTFQGTCSSTNESGRFVSHSVNNKTWLQDYAQANSVSNAAKLQLIYHLNADPRGDVIEVIQGRNDPSPYPLYSLFFGEAFGRVALTNGPGTEIRRIEYIYGHQNDHSVGSAVITEKVSANAHGQSPKIRLHGQLQYLILPDNAHQPELCIGTFTTGKPITLSTTNSMSATNAASGGP